MTSRRQASVSASSDRPVSPSASPPTDEPPSDTQDSISTSTKPRAVSSKRKRGDSSVDDASAKPGPSKGTKGKAKYIPNRVKRYHERSLAGCLTCRKRRVKCDEERPTCRRCACGDRECVYADESTPSGATEPGSNQQITSTGGKAHGSRSPSLVGLQVTSLVHQDKPSDPPKSAYGISPSFSPAGVGPSPSYHRPAANSTTSPHSTFDAASPLSPHRTGRARASTTAHNDRYRVHNGSNGGTRHARQAAGDYDHHRPHAYPRHPYSGSVGSSSTDVSKVKIPELPAGLGFDHLDAYFPTYEQQCLFRHYVLEVAPQLCVIRIPLSDNRWIRYHATFAVRHSHGVNGYEDALRSALLSMASLDIGHKLSQSPIPDLFPSSASRAEASSRNSNPVGSSAGGTREMTGPSLHSSISMDMDKAPEGMADVINGTSTNSIMSNVLLELSNLRREESLRLLRTTLQERRAPLDRSNAAIMLATVLGLATRDRLAAQQDWQDALHIASRAIAELGGPAAFVDQSDPSSLFLIEQIACFDALSSLTSDDYTLFLQPWDDWWYALMDSPRSIKEDSVLQTFGLHRGMIDMLARMTRVEATRRELQERTSVTIILSETPGGGSPPALPPEYEETRLWLESTARALVAEIPIWAKMPFPAEATRTLQTLLPVIMNHLYVAAAELYIHSVIFAKPADHPCFAEPTAVVLNRTEEAIQAGITKGLVLPLSFAAFSTRYQDRGRIRVMLNQLRPYYKFDLERMEKLNEHLWSLIDSGLTPTDWGMFLKSVGCFNWAF
ncbi:Protein of unknown function DUF3468 [Kalmanozyma brasiliensis GHG001]|uniref:Zn(2)-C6 fungal-type domain-containing protein n=1 Tax=Kalmanozyma brasiliensis (strain GHG001) TaxID=1365824 RepID=V5GUR2_KALBG|nr:Protein of unknown function DUF3468 [Kalmanozyma brasiliensis GHG001]EST09637.1 Protein of unknown function DUF3468 [Kalmanozyma brasiliensis GHG001]